MTNENEINTMSNPLEGAYAIEYNYEGGTSDMMPLQLVLPGGYFIVHDAPTKEGYIFQYWYDENGKIYDEGEVVFPSGNIFLRPYWISVPYTLTFDLNGGEGEFHEFNESAGIFVTIPEVVPTKEGFWFSYWISNDGTVYHPLEPYVMQEKNDTLTAVWEERETFTVIYDLDGGTPEIASVTVLEGEEYTLPEIYPEKEKHFFTGWIDKDNPDGEMYFPGYTYVIEKNLNLKACLKRFYTIVYDVNGGNETIYDGFAEAEFSYWIASEIPTKERHTFLYWVDHNGNVYYPEQEFIPTDDMTLTAVWDEHELCTITFDVDGGTPEIPSASVYQYESYTVPEIFPEKEGFFFTYWYDEANGVGCNLYEPFIVEKSLNLKAQWYPNPYNVTYDYNGGEGYSSGDCYFPETDVPVLLPTATKEGCNFLYWRDENNNTYNAEEYIRPTGDMTLTAVWERYAYAISYDEGNIENTVVNIGESYIVTDVVPTKEHHTFLYWRDEENNIFVSGDIFTPTDDVILCAVWEEDQKYTVTYDVNGGTPEIASVTVYEGESYTIAGVILEKEGYYFSAWEDSETSERYSPEHTFIVTKGTTLKAVWTPNPYFVTYDAGEEEPFHSEYVEAGMSTSVISSIPEKEGYSFLHWSDGNGNAYVSGDAFTPTSDTELTAVWEVETYYVTYDLAGGEGSFPEQIKTYGVDIVLHEGTPTKEGYSFICWRDEEGNAHSPEEICLANKGLSLTALWSYTLTFDMNGADSEIEAVTKNEGEYISLTDIPTREGYDFDGFENKNGEYYSRYVFDKGEDTLRAIWKEKRYLVTYDLNGGEGSFPTQEKSYFAPITLHEGVPSKLDTVFVTWKTEDGRSFVPNALYEINESLQLKAFWENEITYTVVYNVDGGEGNLPEQIKTHGIDLSLYDEVPTREGYTFLHWRDESGRTYLPGEDYTENEGVTLTAVWTATLTFDINGGEGEIEALTRAKGETVTLSDVPEKEGWELAYWIGTDGTIYLVNGEYVFNKGNDTLTAVWREKTVTVTYNLDGGEGFFPEQEKGYFDTVTLHTNTPTKEGYEFLGWRDARYNYYDGVTEYSGTENLTLIARWRRVYTITYLDQNGNVFATQQKYHGEIIRLYNETPESSDGSWFAYWVIKETGEYAAAGRKFKKNLDATLRPCYDKYYDVTYYDSDGETVLDEHGILGGTRTISSSAPTKSGYTFLCWNLDGTNRYYLPGESFDLDSDMAFIAVWVEDGKKAIVYDVEGNEGEFELQVANEGSNITIPSYVPTKEGEEFVCWEISSDSLSAYEVARTVSLYSTQTRFFPGDVFQIYQSFRLRPVWGRKTYSISYNTNGGSGIYESQAKTHGEDVFIYSNAPIKLGEDFLGWVDTLTGKTYFPSDKYTKNKPLILKAQWGKSISVTSVSIENKNITVGINEQLTLNAIILPENATNKSLRWGSNNGSAVKIDAYTGEITPLKKGTAIITVSTLDGTLTDTCKITVDPRERVYITKDGDFFNIEFSDGLVWKSIECDLSLDENRSGEELWIEENYNYLTPQEQRYLFNSKQSFSIKQLSYIYRFDPLGIEYFVKNIATQGLSVTNKLLFKDALFEDIYGEQPVDKFKFKIQDGEIVYGEYNDNRENYYTNAEILFGSHNIFDWNDFLQNILIGLFESINIVGYLKMGIELYQALFHTSSFKGLFSIASSNYIKDYYEQELSSCIQDKFGDAAKTVVCWANNLVSVLWDATIDSFVIPNLKDVEIYQSIKEHEHFKTIFQNISSELTFDEIITLCS